MRIRELMSQPVVTCPADCTADVPARLMWEFDCGVIPLVDSDGRLTGVVTDRDLCMAALMQGKPLYEISCNSVMTRDVMSVNADDGIETAESQMRDGKVRRVPVVDEDHHPIGVVSMNDLARLASGSKRSTIDRELVRTLSTISQPRGHALHLTPVENTPAPANVLAMGATSDI